jgi:hypothetical protein
MTSSQGRRVAFEKREVYEESGMSILPVSLMPLVHVSVMLGMLFDMEHLCALPQSPS